MKYKKIEIIGGFKVTKHEDGKRHSEVLKDENGNVKIFKNSKEADKAIKAETPKKTKNPK
jgi:hypothetical protein